LRNHLRAADVWAAGSRQFQDFNAYLIPPIPWHTLVRDDAIPVAIATSNCNGDTGLFELNFRDERYLPFEGAGAISTWHLELPSVIRSFDYDTIADVIIHLSYNARDGGESFKQAVNTQLITALNNWKKLLIGATKRTNN